MIIEVCVDSLNSAIIANNCGADQVELISMSEVGGITPSIGLVKSVLERNIKVMAMIRPRAAGFCYDEYDKEVMLKDIEEFRNIGVQGVVFGALNEDASIDYDFVKKVVSKADNTEVIFHRAFEVVKNKVESAKKLYELGVDRILTKGGNSLINGKDIVKKLVDLKKPQIISGGVRFETLDIIKEIGLKFVHVSSAKGVVDPSTSNTGIYYGRNANESDEIYHIADEEYLKNIISKLRNL